MTPLPAGEWSVPYDGAPPDALKPYIEEVVRYTHSLVPQPGDDNRFAVPDRPRVVTILGHRGTGKSTVLRFALRTLGQAANRLVLPVIDPEVFAQGDTLAGWVLAHLDAELSTAEKGFEVDRERTLNVVLEDLGRTQAVRGSAFLSGLEQRGLTFEDFGRDAVKVPVRGSHVGDEWSTLLEGLAAARHQVALQLVIAVDDADLVPEILPNIVADAQLLGASIRTTVIFAADMTTLRQSLELGLLASYHTVASQALQSGLLTAKSVRELVSRRLVKSFPRSLRVELKPLDLVARLSFKPLGGDRTLLELLEGVPLEACGYSRVSDMFQVRATDGSAMGPSDHAHCLSDNARDLRQLYEAIEAIRVEHPRAATEVLTVLLRHGLEAVASELPPDIGEPIIVHTRHDTTLLEFDFRALDFGKTWGGGELLYNIGDDEQQTLMGPSLVARFVRDFYVMKHEPDEGNGRTSDVPSSREEYLPEQFAGLLSLAWEMVQEETANGPLLREQDRFGRFVLPGGGSWANQVTVAGLRDIRLRYWSVPQWEAFSDYYIFGAGWNRIVGALHKVEPKSAELTEFMLLSHLRLVVQVQRDRTVPKDLASLTDSEISRIIRADEWPAHRDAFLAELFASIADLLTQTRGSRFVRDGDFVAWFDGRFPLFASRLFCTVELSARLLDYWEKQVLAVNRDAAVTVVAGVAREHVNSILAEADLELLDRLDEAQGQLMRSVREQLLREHDSRRTAVLRQLSESNVPSAVIDAIQSTGLTRQAYLALALAGVRPDVIALAAETFKPREVPEDAEGSAGGENP